MVSHKVAPAIATNNCVVVKPTELTPMTALVLADILYEAGLPPEMLSVVTGWPKDIGDEMITNPNIDLITFTGGVPVGKLIASKAGYKRQVLELGGNDPLIILNDLSDDDLAKAADLAVAGATKNSGQRCTAVKRILVQESIADRFVPLVLERAKKLQVRRSDGSRRPTSAPWCTSAPRSCSRSRVHMAAEAGRRHPLPSRPAGRAAAADRRRPRAAHASELVMEETFGPIVPIIRAPDDDDALIALSNSTAFGLSSGVCTNDFRRMQKYIAGLKVGTVNIWEVPGYRIEMSPFGGIKDSRQRLQGRRHRGDEELHQREDLLAALVNGSSLRGDLHAI